MKALRSKAPEMLRDLSECVSLSLVEMLGIEKEKAAQVGNNVADKLADNWGGQNVYFPMGLSYRLSNRDRLICQEFNGSNHGELARKYHLSLQWIYKIVSAAQRESNKLEGGK